MYLCFRASLILSSGTQNQKVRLYAGNPRQEFIFRYVPKGKTRIGLTDEERISLAKRHGNLLLGHNARPCINVEFTEGFFILDREVTRGQFEAVMNSAGESAMTDAQSPDTGVANWPATDDGSVPRATSWRDAWDFCNRLRLATYLDVRLPTELEWEYAARGPKSCVFPGGDEPPVALDGNMGAETYTAVLQQPQKNRPLPLLVRTQDRSWCGVLDLSGNLSEWCLDKYVSAIADVVPDNSTLVPRSIRLDDYLPGKQADSRTFRGANIGDTPLEAAAALRRSLTENKTSDRIGFRPVITLKIPTLGCPHERK
jgi:formylglycine-generating enzyme required for sulfatase activity